uniref:hypothetical protein n=1 Tax=Nonomuraea pusilla TaxID=46177 RepID=UPI0006E2188F|nr:hypothetical protein [Nonomuraea pusilla]
MTEHELRELLDDDSSGGHHRGVTVEDVYARARRIRGRRAGLAGGAGAMAAAAVAAVALALPPALPSTLPSALPSEARGPAERGAASVLAQPSGRPSDTPSRGLPYEHRSERGGTAETFTFTAKGGKALFLVRCPRDGYALIWLNGRFAGGESCPPARVAPPREAQSLPLLKGVNEVKAALVPASAAGDRRMTGARAGKLLDSARPYRAEWSVTVMKNPSCEARTVVLDPRTGEVRFRCPSKR